ncbi:sodium-dependent transporter [Listeria weihenstephanensis]|uniref:Sodium-dependent transporter n=1 Tax=Listeria weihenstephanensis TaxID=1006155 RepID=A0A841Z9D3_9LIST|nr:sodium-dependent transporter [Listeria weihenstephanensis]MBC1501036.1 sodium-dependent transporter [Listeria weihenstephanensis]
MKNNREQWSSKSGFILASAGSAIGIGAIWKLPYVASTAGGGAFFILFTILTFVIVLPILIGEYIIGRHSQSDAIHSYRILAPGTRWNWLGKLGVFGSILVLAFYGVVGGWILSYIVKAISGSVSHGDQAQLALQFDMATANTAIAIAGTAIFLLLVILVVSQGIRTGIEPMSKIMIPALFLLFIILIIRSLTLPNAIEGLQYFLRPDFSEINSKSIIIILGQAFFSLSVGISVMVTYGSYLDRKISIPAASTSVAVINVIISLFVGLAIFPAVFSFGVIPDAGPGILFVILPSIFNQLPFGTFFFIVFLILFFFAALTSSFSLLETATAPFIKKLGSRSIATWIVGGIVFLLAIPAALSLGIWNEISIFGMTIFGAFDYVASNIILPLGALFTAIFVGFRLPRQLLWDEFTASSRYGKKLFMTWLLLLKYVAPIAIILIFLSAIGLLPF